MSRLPEGMKDILHAAPKKEAKREHLLNIMHWRLVRGRTFKIDDLITASRMNTSRRYAAKVVQSVIDEGLAVRQPDGLIGPGPANHKGVQAMMLHYARNRDSFTRRELWLAMPVALPANTIDRRIKDLISQGEFEKLQQGSYRKTRAATLSMAA
jgi:hypothetical protein